MSESAIQRKYSSERIKFNASLTPKIKNDARRDRRKKDEKLDKYDENSREVKNCRAWRL